MMKDGVIENRVVYLDHAATTPCASEVVEAMKSYYAENFGNPSSPYQWGGVAEAAIDQARGKVANLIGAERGEVVFTGSGSESDNTAIKGVALKLQGRGKHIITSQIEHPAVLESCRWLERQGFSVTYLPVDKAGLLDPGAVKQAITKGTILISIMHANNEVGTIEPIEEIGQIAKEREIYFHVDAVQTTGSVAINVKDMKVDLLSMSAHKLYGPKGVGALYIRQGVLLDPLIHGGEQENRRRASTENVAGIVGFGKAAELARRDREKEEKRLSYLRDKLRDGILTGIENVKLNGHRDRRLPNNVNISVAQVEGEGMVLHLDAKGIMCSTGSACSSHNLQPSHVLLAMGLPHELAHGSLRFTLGHSTTEESIDKVLEELPLIVEKLRAMSPLAMREKVV